MTVASEHHGERDIVEALQALTIAVLALVDLLSGVITVNIINAQNGAPYTIELVPGTPRHN